MIQTTHWSPDTCGCVFDYQWDDTLSGDERVHTVSKIVHTCSEHQIVKLNPSGHFSVVVDENVRKNKVYGKFTENTDIYDASIGDFKSGISLLFSWSGTDYARILTASVSGFNLKGSEKNTLQTWCNDTFGIDKVIIL